MLALPGGFRYPLVFVFIFIAEPQPTDLCVVPPATMKGVFLCTCTHRVWVVTLDPIATTAATEQRFSQNRSEAESYGSPLLAAGVWLWFTPGRVCTSEDSLLIFSFPYPITHTHTLTQKRARTILYFWFRDVVTASRPVSTCYGDI